MRYGMKGSFTLALGALTMTLFPTAVAQKPEPGKISGYMFGDYYVALKHHDDAIQNMNGFWFRRIYLTYDQKLERGFAIRAQLEANSPGDFKTSSTLTPFLKDAYLQYSKGREKVQFGIIPTPTWTLIETWLGYRHIEKTPVDLYKMGEARDFGVALRGFLDDQERTAYWLMIGNGSGTKAETDRGKTFYFSLSHRFTPTLYGEVYADHWQKPGDQDWTTLQGVLAYLRKDFWGGLQYSHQKRQRPNQNDLKLSVLSLYLEQAISSRARLFFRVDSVSEPVPEADKIAYLSLATDAKPTFYLFGLSYELAKDVYLIPNLEVVTYSAPVSGTKPKEDLFLRLTMYYVWR